MATSARTDEHRRVELRSIEMHRLIAERLDPDVIARARAKVQTRDPKGPYARAWLALLDLPRERLAEKLIKDTEEMRDLRQNTPFSAVLTPQERWHVIRSIP